MYIDWVSELFGPNSSYPSLVQIEFSDIDAFNVWLHNQRPQNRIELLEQRDNFHFNYGFLYHDACSLNLKCLSSSSIQPGISDVLAVEIKPKQGWNICTLPEWLLDKLGVHHDLRNTCRFCAMQFLKVDFSIQFIKLKLFCYGFQR